MDVRLHHGDTEFVLRVESGDRITVHREGDENGNPRAFSVRALTAGRYAVEHDHGMTTAEAVRDGDTVWVRYRGRTYRLERPRGRKRGGAGGGGSLASPMPGQVQKILVAEGDLVTEGQPLAVVEAMKMQLEIKAPHAGSVVRVRAAEGDQVDAGVPLVELEAGE